MTDVIHDFFLTSVLLHFEAMIVVHDTRVDAGYEAYVTFCEQSGFTLGLPWRTR